MVITPSVQRSDVPIVRTVGWWGLQDHLSVDSFSAKVVDARLGLLNNKALVEYRITGHLQAQPGWKPIIASVFVSQRYRTEKHDKDVIVGDFEVVPMVDLKSDSKSAYEKLPFDVVVQELVVSPDYGPHTYEVHCGTFLQRFELVQSK